MGDALFWVSRGCWYVWGAKLKAFICVFCGRMRRTAAGSLDMLKCAQRGRSVVSGRCYRYIEDNVGESWGASTKCSIMGRKRQDISPPMVGAS